MSVLRSRHVRCTEREGCAIEGKVRLFGAVPTRNRNFTGRGELLARLQGLQRRAVKVQPFDQFHGLRGIGKSQLAIEWTYKRVGRDQSCAGIPWEKEGASEKRQHGNLNASVKEWGNFGEIGTRPVGLALNSRTSALWSPDRPDPAVFHLAGERIRVIVCVHPLQWCTENRRNEPVGRDASRGGWASPHRTRREYRSSDRACQPVPAVLDGPELASHSGGTRTKDRSGAPHDGPDCPSDFAFDWFTPFRRCEWPGIFLCARSAGREFRASGRFRADGARRSGVTLTSSSRGPPSPWRQDLQPPLGGFFFSGSGPPSSASRVLHRKMVAQLNARVSKTDLKLGAGVPAARAMSSVPRGARRDTRGAIGGRAGA